MMKTILASIVCLSFLWPVSAIAGVKQTRLYGATAVADQAVVASAYAEAPGGGATFTGLLCKVTSAFVNTSCAGAADPEACCSGVSTGTCAAQVKIDARVCANAADCGVYDVAVIADTGAQTNPVDWNFIAQPAALLGIGVQYQATGLADNPSDALLTCYLLHSK